VRYKDKGAMRKIYLAFIALFIFATHSNGQQKPQYTQYMINPFLVNPAVSGTEDYTDIRAGYRKQWAGFEGAPRTIFVSAHTNFGKSKVVNNRTKNKKNGFHGAGVIISNDVIGPTSTLNANAAYSYHLALSKTWFASLGIMGGMQQYQMEGSQLRTTNPGDVAITSITSRALADVNAGGWIYSDKFYAGASIIQVVPQKLYNSREGITVQGKSANHFILMAGYRFPLGYDFTYIPSVCIKAVSPAPVSYDINSKIRYRDFGWIGISYRNKDAVALMAGIIINNTFDLSYSYDATTSNIRKYSGGSHEIIVGYRLRTRQQVICPSSFW